MKKTKSKIAMLFFCRERLFLVLAGVALVLLSVLGTVYGARALGWSINMQDVHNAVYFRETTVTFDGVAYQILPLPEGVDKHTLYDAIDLGEYDDVVTGYGGQRYLVFHDPLESGDDVYFMVPLANYAGFLLDLAEPFAYYVKEVAQ